MTHEDYVTFEQAKALKELGFDWTCSGAFYDEKDNKHKLNHAPASWNDNNSTAIAAPTLSQAADWLRKTKELYIEVQRIGFYDWSATVKEHSQREIELAVNPDDANEENPYWGEFDEIYGEYVPAEWNARSKNGLVESYEEALSDGITTALQILIETKDNETHD